MVVDVPRTTIMHFRRAVSAMQWQRHTGYPIFTAQHTTTRRESGSMLIHTKCVEYAHSASSKTIPCHLCQCKLPCRWSRHACPRCSGYCNAMQRTSRSCHAGASRSRHCNTVHQGVGVYCTVFQCRDLQDTATQCNKHKYRAVCVDPSGHTVRQDALTLTATHCNTQQHMNTLPSASISTAMPLDKTRWRLPSKACTSESHTT